MNRSAQPTLEDVARVAGASTATVSRCINEPDKVAKATRERVNKAIKELGYTPHFGGKALASNRSNTVGAVIPSMENAMFASALQAFQETLSEAGVILLVASSGYDPQQEFEQIRSLLAHGADGLLLIGTSRPQESINFLKLRQVPCVSTWCYEAKADTLFAGFDNALAAASLCTHVLEAGHRDIAMIAGQSAGNDRAASRIAGVRRAVKEFNKQQPGEPVQLIDVVETPYSVDNGGIAFEKLMSAETKPSAVICGNDVLAAGAIARAHRLGISVPSDVSITGFDDINLASVVTPGITTVRVPHVDMGRTAAKLLLEFVASGAPPGSVEFDTKIVERGSLAPPGT